MNGFLSKEMFFAGAAAKQTRADAVAAAAGAVAAGVASVAYGARFVARRVLQRRSRWTCPRVPREPPFFMRLPVMLLAGLCVAVGLAPGDGQ